MRKSFAWLALLFFCFAIRLSAQQPPLEDQFRTVAWFPPGTTGKSLNVRIQGATVLFNGTNVVVPDQVILLPDNATTFIDFEGSKTLVTSQVGFGSINPVYYPIALVITSQGNVSQISDQRPTYTLSSGGGGGGSNPPPPAGIVPVANALVTGFIASSILDNGTIVVTTEPMTVGALTSNGDAHLKGPNPVGVDVTLYGVRGLANVGSIPAVPGTLTATINATQTSATVSTASCPAQTGSVCFVNGDGVIIYGAGPATTLSTPGTPTVTPSEPRSGSGTGDLVASPAGGTTYQYQVVARDKNGGLTAASTAGTTSIGQASLGSQSVAITSATCSGNTVTVTTSSAHTLAVGAQIMISVASGGNSCINGIVTEQVSGSADNTHFTYQQGILTTNGGATSFSGTATVFWLQANKITWTAVPNTWQYYIYGRTSGSMALIGVTHPSSAAANDTTFEDYGATMMASSTLGIPSYVPSTPPASAQAQPLITTIAAGAGTTSLTLANAATTSVTNATILFTDGPNIVTAATAASNLYWPIIGFFVVNSFTDVASVNSNSSWMYTGGLVLNETLSYRGSWQGQTPNLVSGNFQDSFNFMGEPVVTTNSNPGVYLPFAGSVFFDRLAFKGGQNAMFIDTTVNSVPSGPQFGQHMYFGDGGSSDYMGIPLYIRSTTGLGMIAGRINIATGPGQQGGGFTGSTFTPSIYVADGGGVSIDALFMQDRGLLFRPDFNSASLKVKGGYTQGGIQPFVTVTGAAGGGGQASGNIEISHFIDDTTFQPYLTYLPNAGSFVGGITIGNMDSPPGDGTPVITGPTQNWFVTGTTSGQNTNAIAGSNFTDETITVNGTSGSVGYPMNPPVAPISAVVSAGGAVPTGLTFYAIAATDSVGNLSQVGASISANVTSGNQTVTITPPTPANLPAGTVGLKYFRGNSSVVPFTGLTGVSSNNCGPFSPTATFVDTLGFQACAPPLASQMGRALTNGLGSTGVETTALNLIGGGFTSTETGTFTANRALARPDLNGTMGVLTAGCNSTNFLGGDNVCRAGSGVNISTNGTLNLSQTVLNMQTSSVNAVGLSLTPNNPSGGIETFEIAGRLVPFGGGTGLSSPTAHSLLVTEGAANMNLVTSPAVNGFYACGFNVAASAAVDPACSLQGVPVNTPSTPYTGVFSDRATYQRLTGGSTFSFTLPQVTGNTAANFPFVVQNGNSGLLTFTANAADNIDGSGTGGTSTLLSKFAAFVYQDGTAAPGNWWTIKMPTFSAFGSTCANILSWSTSSGFSCVNATGSMFANFSAHQFLGNNTGSSAAPGPELIGASDTSPNAYAAATGTAQAQVVALTPAVTALTVGLEVDFLPVAANTGAAPTLAVNGLAATTITKLGSSAALVANDLTTNAIAKVIYDGTEFQLLNPQTTSGSSVPCTTTAGSLQYNNAGAFGCTTPFTFAANTITAAAAGILDLSGATGANAFKIPVQAGCTAGADGDLCYDSTNKNTHVRANAADAINLAIPSAPTTGDLADYTVSSGNVLAHDSGVLTANVVTQTSNAASGQVCTYTGANKVCVPATALPNGVTATTQSALDSSTKVATTAYTDTAVANGIAGSNPAVAVQAATVGSSDLSGYTYSNGVSGIGATLTAGSNNVALTVDGFTFNGLAQRILVKNQSTAAQNGIYTVTQLQGVALPVILTRALDYDQPSDINNTGAIPVVNGTANADTSWLLTSTVNTVGTDALTYVQFSLAPTSIVTAAATLTSNIPAIGAGSKTLSAGYTFTPGTVTSGRIACYTSSGTVGNCTALGGVLGIFNSTTTWTSSGEVPITLDATVSVTFGDHICQSSVTPSQGHDNGNVACTQGLDLGFVKTTAASVSSATIFVALR